MAGSVPSLTLHPHVDRKATLRFVLLHGWRSLAFALQVRRERRALARLGESQLKDIGRSRADATREAGRAFWDLPRER